MIKRGASVRVIKEITLQKNSSGGHYFVFYSDDTMSQQHVIGGIDTRSKEVIDWLKTAKSKEEGTNYVRFTKEDSL